MEQAYDYPFNDGQSDGCDNYGFYSRSVKVGEPEASSEEESSNRVRRNVDRGVALKNNPVQNTLNRVFCS